MLFPFKNKCYFFIVFFIFFLNTSVLLGQNICPPKEKLTQSLQKVLNRDVEIISLKASAYKGLCEIYTRTGNKSNIVYTDNANMVFVFGHLVESATGKSLTKKALEEYTRLSTGDIKYLKSLVAFSIGKADLELFVVTDPQCPYCKEGEKILKKMADNNELTTHFILFPLDFHKGSREQCISVICDKKGFKGFESGYKSDNQCEEGKNKVNASISFIKKKGMTGTPAYIFEDGIIHKGLMREPDLRKRLKLF